MTPALSGKLLEGKKAIITGSRRSIGAGIAQLFAEHGAEVGVNDVVSAVDSGSNRTKSDCWSAVSCDGG